MTAEASDRRRRSVSLSLPDVGGAPVDQLGRAVEILCRVNLTLPSVLIRPEELIALGGHLTQINLALMNLTDLLCASAYHYDRTQLTRARTTTPADRAQTAASLLRECRDGYLAAYASAQALHADLRRFRQTGPPRRKRRTSSETTT